MRFCIFEDAGTQLLEPLTLTRPAFALRCGARTLLDRQCAATASNEIGLWVRPELVELCRWQYPDLAVNDEPWLREQPVVLVNARWLPPAASQAWDTPGVGLVDGHVAWLSLDPDESLPEVVDAWD